MKFLYIKIPIIVVWWTLSIIGWVTGTLLHWSIPFLVGLPILPMVESKTDNVMIFTTIRQRVFWKLTHQLCQECNFRPTREGCDICDVCCNDSNGSPLFRPLSLGEFRTLFRDIFRRDSILR